MDLKGSLVDTNLRIYPTEKLLNFVQSLPIDKEIPLNIIRLVKGKDYKLKKDKEDKDTQKIPVHFNTKDLENLEKINSKFTEENVNQNGHKEVNGEDKDLQKDDVKETKDENPNKKKDLKTKLNEKEKSDDLYLTTTDIDWLFTHLLNKRKEDKSTPYLHVLLEGAQIKTPENEVLKRNPDLEARCVKLRAQEEARQYRKMTKSVDNVRMRFPEDSISYQLKQMNRQLIAIGQFIISIFAGFLFGFRGVEWMVGNLDFGFRLLLGVMCALVIALAEIYFLAKKLNEELSVPETVQLGGPPKFADQPKSYFNTPHNVGKSIEKEHKD